MREDAFAHFSFHSQASEREVDQCSCRRLILCMLELGLGHMNLFLMARGFMNFIWMVICCGMEVIVNEICLDANNGCIHGWRCEDTKF